ncbi:MAG: hypothetical protein K6E50_12625 [Lachnospiraceae bacterium]|nr:hypothetical protein [Lachnospiraceae bacterium]
MTIEAYINPDFSGGQKLLFLFMALLGVVFCILLITGGAWISRNVLREEEDDAEEFFAGTVRNRVQRFFEMIIAGTSVLSFSCAYVVINHIYAKAQEMGGGTGSAFLDGFLELWGSGKDFMLLLLICLSCLLNSLLDRLVIPLKKTGRGEKACVRMLAMFYCIFILLYLYSVGDESEYHPVMMYYLGLMVGRFVYFDASFRDFLASLVNMFRNCYLLLLCLALSSFLFFFGFSRGYLLEKNYYIVCAFYVHLFMLVAVFIIHHAGSLILYLKKRRSERELAE